MMSNDYTQIDAYLFDLGGVIVDIDPQAAIAAFEKLGLNNLHEQITHGHHQGLFKQYELGVISSQQFVDAIQELLPSKVSDQTIIDAWNTMLVHLPIERIRLIEKLSKQKPVYLLSNTNAIHHQAYVSMVSGIENVETIFNKAFYSYEIGLSKPNASIFKHVIDNAPLQAERTLFLDDSHLNLDAAEQLGFQTALIGPKQSMLDVLSGHCMD
ncbi:HAD family phosphatase [Carboxylicivirga sp. M1479]|uniref:HAD family hydrolase n=1 Tax=Carboxylicivirga sp. M1479 TaxID=2594476 RepID=UPI00163D95E9|nr:HAD family phosphatase [Carboxylicivirga sp. M1479]